MPGESRGVRLKLKLPKVAAYAERLGWRSEERRIFKVMAHCGKICPILVLGSLGLAWLFLLRSDFSIFGLRALRRFGDARAGGQVGILLGIF